MNSLIDWLAGGAAPGGGWNYMRLSECMGGDAFWLALTVALDFAVASGYVLIALHWWRNQRTLPKCPAKEALGSMRNIFLFCGCCGYAFIPIKMFWPAWRLYDLMVMVLVYFTWKYAWNARDLKVIYSELGRSTQLAADLEKTREESRQKSVFLNSISHDLRTPLNGLVLQTGLARMGLGMGDKELVGNALNEIEASARTTADMLDRLLEYARLNVMEERNALSMVPLAGLLRQITQGFVAQAREKGLALDCACPADLRIRTDAVKLERIVGNLLSNALKFTPAGSVRLEVEQDGTAVEIHVIDTGIGIAEDHREQLFQEFYQVGNRERDRAKGFGLGLAIARRLTRQLGGDLTVESSAGHGSRFSILLPDCITRESSPGAAAHARSPIPVES